MTNILSAIFRPRDGSRRKVAAEVKASGEKVVDATSRFEKIIQDMIDHNDNLTGRKNNAQLDSAG